MEIDRGNYYVYIITDIGKTILETGLTGALNVRLEKLETELNAPRALNSNRHCKYLLYWEHYQDIPLAMAREKEMKRMSTKKMKALISEKNPEWRFLNKEIAE